MPTHSRYPRRDKKMEIRKRSSRLGNQEESFQYVPLPSNESQIRLLVFANNNASGIHYELKAVRMDAARNYSAISYSWGEEPATKTIFLNNKKFLVRQNLYDALSEFRNRYETLQPAKKFWIDAVCIDQSNPVEKGQQIQLMQKIFSKATETLVWLGKEVQGSNMAFDVIKDCSEHYKKCTESEEQDELKFNFGERGRPSTWGKEEHFVHLEHLLSRPWWRRAWIVQEIAVSKTVLVCCGKLECPWEEVAAAAALLIWDIPGLTELLLRQLEEEKSLLSLRTGCARIDGIDDVRLAMEEKVHHHRGKSSARTLFKLLSTNSDALATEKRDKCVAFAGLALPAVFPLTVEDCSQAFPEEVYIMAARSIIKEEKQSRLKFLEYAGKPSELSSLPSWVPDWSYTGDRASPLLFRQLQDKQDNNIQPYKSAGEIPCSSQDNLSVREDDSLSVYGFVFDLVDGVSACGCGGVLSTHNRKECPRILHPVAVNYKTVAKSSADLADELWRTMVMNRDHRQVPPPEAWKRLSFHALQQLANHDEELDEKLDDTSFWVKKWYNDNKAFRPWGTATLEDIVKSQVNNNSTFLSGEGEVMAEIRERIEHVTNLRRLCTTRKGHLALMPADTQHGDIVAIFFDSDLPVILRPRDNGWEFIGCGYVHGIMEAEAMGNFNEKKVAARTFDIR